MKYNGFLYLESHLFSSATILVGRSVPQLSLYHFNYNELNIKTNKTPNNEMQRNKRFFSGI